MIRRGSLKILGIHWFSSCSLSLVLGRSARAGACHNTLIAPSRLLRVRLSASESRDAALRASAWLMSRGSASSGVTAAGLSEPLTVAQLSRQCSDSAVLAHNQQTKEPVVVLRACVDGCACPGNCCWVCFEACFRFSWTRGWLPSQWQPVWCARSQNGTPTSAGLRKGTRAMRRSCCGCSNDDRPDLVGLVLRFGTCR